MESTKETKYWKNQQLPEDLSSPFVDPEFPPNENSLLSKDKEGNFIDKIVGEKKASGIDLSIAEWKRLGELLEDGFVFEDKIECSDVKQGILGNCYFLSSLAALTEYPKFIFNAFKTKEVSPIGLYEITLFIDGEWQTVIIDDYVPVNSETSKFLFAKPNGNEMWCVLLEKAWAKINGGYTNTISGVPSAPLATITGFSSKKIVHEQLEEEDIFTEIYEADKANCIMCISSNKNMDKSKGLVSKHAYTLIDVLEVENEVGDIYRLAKIRNPWGYGEWKGDWSDSSDLWTEELREKYDVKERNDGVFYMSIADMKTEFKTTHICKLEYGARYKFYPIEGEDLNKPQVFNLHVPEDSSVSISAIRPHERFNRHLKGNNYPISLCVAKYNEEGKFTFFAYDFESKDDADVVEELSAGHYLVWLHTPYSHLAEPKIEKLVLRIYSTGQFNAKHVGPDSEFAVIRSILLADLSNLYKNAVESHTKNVFGKIVNQHSNSGLGYFFAVNLHSKAIKYTFENKLDKMVAFEPFSEESSEMTLAPGGRTVVVGIRTDTQGKYWFNLKNKSKFLSEEEYEKVNELEFVEEAAKFFDFGLEEAVEDEFYDRIDEEMEKAIEDLKFTKEDSPEVFFEKLEESRPNAHSLLFEFKENWTESSWRSVKHNNGLYLGQVDERNRREGVGYYKWDDGKEYVGEWKNGKKHGRGKMFADSRLTYEGEFSDGVKSGTGTMHYKNGSKYEGEFENNKRNGKCLFTWKNGASWTGTALNDKLNGSGTFKGPKGNEKPRTYDNGKVI